MAGSFDSSEQPQTGSKGAQWNVINYYYLLLDSFAMWAGIIYSFSQCQIITFLWDGAETGLQKNYQVQ